MRRLEGVGVEPLRGGSYFQIGCGAQQPAADLRTNISRANTGSRVVDLLENPQLAKGDEIVALPTLVRKLPQPIRKIIGNLSDTEKVLVGLQLRPREENNMASERAKKPKPPAAPREKESSPHS